MNNRRAKKRFVSDTNVIDFQPKQFQNKHVNPHPRNKNQESYLSMLENENTSIIFAVGPAGTGKTLLAVQMGIKAFREDKFDKIIITRPAVSVDEDLGFLPGTLNEKMAPWTKPIFDVFAEYYQQREILKMLEDGYIEISPLAYMRGRTFKNSYIIFDESQNSTSSQMKMVLTRLGENSKMVVTGDLAQADRMSKNGLLEFIDLLQEKKCNTISTIKFTNYDIERHPAVREVLSIYGDKI